MGFWYGLESGYGTRLIVFKRLNKAIDAPPCYDFGIVWGLSANRLGRPDSLPIAITPHHARTDPCMSEHLPRSTSEWMWVRSV